MGRIKDYFPPPGESTKKRAASAVRARGFDSGALPQSADALVSFVTGSIEVDQCACCGRLVASVFGERNARRMMKRK